MVVAMLFAWTLLCGNSIINGVRGEEGRYRPCKEICEDSGRIELKQ